MDAERHHEPNVPSPARMMRSRNHWVAGWTILIVLGKRIGHIALYRRRPLCSWRYYLWPAPFSLAAPLGTGLLCAVALAVAPSAVANVDLAAGMPLNIGRHACSLGFFGFNARQDRLAVTAGHCSDAVPDEPVYADNGVQIGRVVAWRADQVNASGDLVGARGYTVIFVFERFSLEPFFTSVSTSISDGEHVIKFGQRTGKTMGVIKTIQYDRKRPELALISSNMVQLPGDSGCPWYTNDDQLVAMASSGDQEWAGGDAGSEAQPIQAVLDLIRADGSVWTEDFKVWTQ